MSRHRRPNRETHDGPIQLPHNWLPRSYQLPLWKYLCSGGKRACAVWHRRAGKDDVCLHWAAVAAHMRVANYWHMLPEAAQARKAIWEAINPHTGIKRIDEAFPQQLRESTNDQEMLIRFKNGSTWRVVGSDNYNSLVGSSVAGLVFSEWSLANPAAWAYLRPILAENGGWALFIYTPRGKNHGFSLYKAALNDPKQWYCEQIPASVSGVFTPEVLEQERKGYFEEFGEVEGNSRFAQEYECSFEAATLGSVYGPWVSKARKENRIVKDLPHEPNAPVYTAWDLGNSDATAIWWFQALYGEVRILKYHEESFRDIPYFCKLLKDTALYNGWTYGPQHYAPHDAAHHLQAAGGRSVAEIALENGIRMSVKPPLTGTAPIAAARKTLDVAWFDAKGCEKGLETLELYRFKWDENLKVFSAKPIHDWTSHAASAFAILATSWREWKAPVAMPKENIYAPDPGLTFNDLLELNRKERRERNKYGRR